MTTSEAHPNPAAPPTHAAPAPNTVQVHCIKCNHPNPWNVRFCGQCGAWMGAAKAAALAEANRLVASHPDLHHATHDRSVGFYALIFLSLCVTTLLEIIVVAAFESIPVLMRTGLFFFATVKFLLVAMFFMHLKGDTRLYGTMFTIGIIVAAGTLFSLYALFHIF